ncbi:MAG: DUF6938 domain-containing protein [Nannocystales bacterium]
MQAPRSRPLIAAAEMGYGHLRAARPLAQQLGTELTYVDREPLAGRAERGVWEAVRWAHAWSSRGSELPVVGPSVRRMLDSVTMIPPLHPYRDLAGPSVATRALDSLIHRGFGEPLAQHLRTTGAALVTTFYAPAIVADRRGIDNVFCVVTDADINRVWAPLDARESNIRYLAPSRRVVRRLRAFGVPASRIEFTGFPLPHALVGGEELSALRGNLGPRLVRLDPKKRFRASCHHELAHFFTELGRDHDGQPPLLTFAVGGAGAQSGLVDAFLPSLRPLLLAGRIRLALVAGTHFEVAARFRRALRRFELDACIGDSVEILSADGLDAYFERFEALIARTDILWTKPSELTFYAALGIPLLLTSPVGVHERFNRRFAREEGVALKQRDPKHIGERLSELLADGTLASAAWSGFLRLPKFGTYRVLEELGLSGTAPPALQGEFADT